jgi:hypothetical protein
MERLRTPYIVPWHPWPGRCPSTRTLVRVRADAAVLPQVTSKRTLQCVQVTDAPAAIVRLSVRPSDCPSVRPSVRKRPRDNPAIEMIYFRNMEYNKSMKSGVFSTENGGKGLGTLELSHPREE